MACNWFKRSIEDGAGGCWEGLTNNEWELANDGLMVGSRCAFEADRLWPAEVTTIDDKGSIELPIDCGLRSTAFNSSWLQSLNETLLSVRLGRTMSAFDSTDEPDIRRDCSCGSSCNRIESQSSCSQSIRSSPGSTSASSCASTPFVRPTVIIVVEKSNVLCDVSSETSWFDLCLSLEIRFRFKELVVPFPVPLPSNESTENENPRWWAARAAAAAAAAAVAAEDSGKVAVKNLMVVSCISSDLSKAEEGGDSEGDCVEGWIGATMQSIGNWLTASLRVELIRAWTDDLWPAVESIFKFAQRHGSMWCCSSMFT